MTQQTVLDCCQGPPSCSDPLLVVGKTCDIHIHVTSLIVGALCMYCAYFAENSTRMY